MAPTDVLVLTPRHPDFPNAVRAMARPPERLYLRGELPRGSALAVVGTRRASAPALAFARSLAERAAGDGWSVWSGGALGIDTAAHQGALDAGGKSVVVMGTGFDHPYPNPNRRLFERILQQEGAWLSPFPPDQTGSRWSFLRRNEVLASLVDHVVIVQAPARSGARSTTAAARRMGKEVWAVPSSPWEVAGAGCLAEIRAGARVMTDTSDLFGGRKRRRASLPRGLSAAERAVAEAVGRHPGNIDGICEATGLTAPEVSSAALTLTLAGVLYEAADGAYHRARE